MKSSTKSGCRVSRELGAIQTTKEGRERCRAAKLIHGRETRKIRNERQQTLAELKVMQRLGKLVEIF